MATLRANHRATIELIEDQLRDAQQQYRDTVETAPFGIFRSTADGLFLSVNQSMSDIFGYSSPEEMLALIHDIPQQLYVDPAARLMFRKKAEKLGIVRNFECQVFRKDGEKIWISAILRAVFKNGIVAEYIGMVEDITQRRLLEERLRDTQKMEALGLFAVSVAHEFNNVLNIIKGYCEILQDSLDVKGTDHRYVGEISKAIVRSSALTRELLIFSRKQVNHPILVNLNPLIRDWYRTMTPLFKKGMSMKLDLRSDLWKVKIDPEQIGQVLINLGLNAGDAMPNGGHMVIKTDNVELDKADIGDMEAQAEGQYVMLSLRDTGSGMDAATQARIFEPFFTTKTPGKGTGLGLATVFGIVKQNFGHIVVDTELKTRHNIQDIFSSLRLSFVICGSDASCACEFSTKPRSFS